MSAHCRLIFRRWVVYDLLDVGIISDSSYFGSLSPNYRIKYDTCVVVRKQHAGLGVVEGQKGELWRWVYHFYTGCEVCRGWEERTVSAPTKLKIRCSRYVREAVRE